MLEIFGSYQLYDYLTKKKKVFKELTYEFEKEKNSTSGICFLGFFFFIVFSFLLGFSIPIWPCSLILIFITFFDWL